MKSLKISSLFLIVLFFSSCSSLFQSIYGMHAPKALNELELFKTASKHGIPLEKCFLLDPSFQEHLNSFDTSQYAEQVKNHSQPLQALYFKVGGELESFQVNCYAGGFPNLNWNGNGQFESFPPKEQAPIDQLIPFKQYLSFLTATSKSDTGIAQDIDYIVVVHWNRFMGRQSERFIELVQENASRQSKYKVGILYVNSDAFFVEEA